MNQILSELRSNPILLALISALAGIMISVVTQQLLNKRGRFTYIVRHDRVGASTEDAVLGRIEVLWNGNPVRVLYSSSVELVNESWKDFDNVTVRVFSADTMLLSERTEYADSTHFPMWAPDYAASMAVPEGAVATAEQLDRYMRRRDYLLPTFNRRQTVRFSLLTTPREDTGPTVWLDILHKGVKVDFRLPRPEILGVPQQLAAAVGLGLGAVVYAAVALYFQTVWSAALVTLVVGMSAQIPGALIVRLWRKIKTWVGD
jgi:hypothetical protein